MIVGIMADSHDNMNALKRVVDFFNENNVDYVLHCGDYIAPFTSRALGKLNAKFFGVFGNNDGEKAGLVKMFEDIGSIVEQPGIVKIDNKKFAIFHEEPGELEADVICYGHTHKPEISKRNNSLIINPGETGGWITDLSTVVLYNTETDEAVVHKI